MSSVISSKAALYTGEGNSVLITTIDVHPPKTGEILVKIKASGVCGSDRHVLDGEWHVPSPTVMGHEGSGIVQALGEGVTHLSVGDHVALVWNQSCLTCVACQSGKSWACTDLRSNECVMPDGTSRLTSVDKVAYPYLAVGSMSEYAVVPATAAIKMPAELPYEVSALIGCAVHTGLGAVKNNSRITAGESAVVIGCGGVGLSILMGLQLAGAYPIIAVDTNPDKLTVAQQLGATHTLLAGDTTASEIQQITAGGADFAFEAIGNLRTIASLPHHLKAGGTGVLVGMPPEGTTAQFDVLDLCYRGITLIASNYGGGVPARDFPRYAALYLDGKLPLDTLISKKIRLEDTNEAFETMRAGSEARHVIMFD